VRARAASVSCSAVDAIFLLATAPGIPWLGKLPGDLRFDWGNVRVHLPLTTSLLLSVALTLLLRLFSKP
jgi:uncharacterized membrane-anchored protein